MATFNSPFTGNVIQPTDVSYRSITLSANTTLSWPINGNATDNYAARIMEVTATAAGLSLTMPPANQASVGQDALIRNVGSNSFTVKDYAGNTIIAITAGQAQYIYITTNANTAGTWGIIAYGIGSSGADAATLAGYGLLAISQTLNQSQNVSTFGSSQGVSSSNRADLLVFNGGTATLTLGTATALGNNFFFSVRNAGSGALTIAGSSGDVINGSASIALQPSDSCVVCCSGTTFYTVGLGKNTQFNFTILTKAVTSGTYTLTPTEAANVIQKYTGTLTGNVTIVVPATVQVYYIQNATTTSSGYTVTISTGVSGGTSAAISANNQSTLICDSANLVNANTILAGLSALTMPDGTVGAPALSFTSEPSTGIYRGGSGLLNIAVLGVNLFQLSSTGLTVNGTGNFTGGISGGSF
jgi:hypothetical protein